MKRIVREHVLQVGDDQFLVLLLVMQTECHDLRDLVQIVLAGALQQVKYVLVHVSPVPIDLVYCGPRGQTALGARILVAGCVVVRVEEVRIFAI